MTRITESDAITIAADDLLQALQNPKILKEHINLTSKHYEALKQLATIFNTTSKEKPLKLKPPEMLIYERNTIKEKTPQSDSNVTAPKTPKTPTPTLIPCKENEKQKFHKFIKRPATHTYNTRHKFQPHVIPDCSNVTNDRRKRMSYKKLVNSEVRDVWTRAMTKELGHLS